MVTRYCARCGELRAYTERPIKNGFEQSCIVCGCCVGYRFDYEEHEPYLIDPYRKYDDEPMTYQEFMNMKL